MQRHRSMSLVALILAASSLVIGGCDGRDELRNIDRGTDQPPAIKDEAPEESQ